MDELKLCPFCGGKGELVKTELMESRHEMFCVECTKCPAKIDVNAGSIGTAITLWNKRV